MKPILTEADEAINDAKIVSKLTAGMRSPGYEDRKGSYHFRYTGGFFWPCDPRVEEIAILDIAHALSNQCRFQGHVTGFLSVAEHSVKCSHVGSQEEALERLLHDAAEAYLGDWSRPIKTIPKLRDIYLPLERQWERAIAERFGLVYPWPSSVRIADEAVIQMEMAHAIMNSNKGNLHDASVTPATGQVDFWTPENAKRLFLRRYHDLASARGVM